MITRIYEQTHEYHELMARPQKPEKVLYPNLSYDLYGICFRIHNNLGRYRNEQQYSDALEVELREKGISYKREQGLEPSFEGEQPGRNIVDFIIEDKIILEIKAKRRITKEDYYQVRRYLDSSKKRLGIIVNFRQHSLVPKRIAN